MDFNNYRVYKMYPNYRWSSYHITSESHDFQYILFNLFRSGDIHILYSLVYENTFLDYRHCVSTLGQSEDKLWETTQRWSNVLF